MTQHGKDFPNRVRNTTTNTTTQRMSLTWSRPTHEGNALDDFRSRTISGRHKKRQSTRECPALGEFCWYWVHTRRGYLDAIWSSIQTVTATPPRRRCCHPLRSAWGRCLHPSSDRGWNGSPRRGLRPLGGVGSAVLW